VNVASASANDSGLANRTTLPREFRWKEKPRKRAQVKWPKAQPQVSEALRNELLDAGRKFLVRKKNAAVVGVTHELSSVGFEAGVQAVQDDVGEQGR
jgi:hypothetical protein